jgi:hypothetical protein
MKTLRRWRYGCTLSLGLALVTGCQTWTGGMTLPTGRYLQHPPQYIPESPAYPFTRELASQEAAAVGQAPAPGAPVAPAPPPPAPQQLPPPGP